jgi:protein-tyrosine phosphatase
LLEWPPLRDWLRRRALAAWRAGHPPLILCYGNINRSPFAAALVRARRPGTRSAGFYPVENRPAPDDTTACAARYGVDLTAHRSRCVTNEELRSAEVIFLFDLETVARVVARAPRALARTHLVGSLDGDPRVLIADPHGRGTRILEDTLSRIAQAVEQP